MKHSFAGQHFDAIDDLSMGMEASLRRLAADLLQTIFMNGYGDWGYAVRAAENTLSEHSKMGYSHL
jgi:hypothetical protein